MSRQGGTLGEETNPLLLYDCRRSRKGAQKAQPFRHLQLSGSRTRPLHISRRGKAPREASNNVHSQGKHSWEAITQNAN